MLFQSSELCAILLLSTIAHNCVLSFILNFQMPPGSLAPDPLECCGCWPQLWYHEWPPNSSYAHASIGQQDSRDLMIVGLWSNTCTVISFILQKILQYLETCFLIHPGVLRWSRQWAGSANILHKAYLWNGRHEQLECKGYPGEHASLSLSLSHSTQYDSW